MQNLKPLIIGYIPTKKHNTSFLTVEQIKEKEQWQATTK